ncbi:MAG: hypothetical protein WDN04_26470 [Rhodospirillales bacterium]
MDALLAQIFSGLATGSIYASVALALVMIYQATHLVNFAQAELAMVLDLPCVEHDQRRHAVLGGVFPDYSYIVRRRRTDRARGREAGGEFAGAGGG